MAEEENPLKGVSCQVDEENVVELEGVSHYKGVAFTKQGAFVSSVTVSCCVGVIGCVDSNTTTQLYTIEQCNAHTHTHTGKHINT